MICTNCGKEIEKGLEGNEDASGNKYCEECKIKIESIAGDYEVDDEWS